MKKLIMFSACAMLAVVTQAATVGWNLAGAANYANDAYQFFVIGQNGVSSIATITALLDAGTDTSSYAFGSGTVSSTGTGMVLPGSSGKSLDAGTYTSFFVVFDSASPTSGSANYVVVDGLANQTKTIGASTANVTFASGNAASIINNANNWHSFGPASSGDGPEPTSGLLLLIGAGILGLRRKQK